MKFNLNLGHLFVALAILIFAKALTETHWVRFEICPKAEYHRDCFTPVMQEEGR